MEVNYYNKIIIVNDMCKSMRYREYSQFPKDVIVMQDPTARAGTITVEETET